MPKYKKCPGCGGMMKYTRKDAEMDEYKCIGKNCGKSYPASPEEKGEYRRQYPNPGK
jgi:DNA-directed RNA polymerase subunit M/transcription elongation factor TFIIS